MRKIRFLLIFVIALLFFSCSKKTKLNLTEHNDSVYDFSYTLCAYNFGGKTESTNLDTYYFPQFLKNFMFFEFRDSDGCLILVAEKFHPEHKGELEAANFYVPECDSGDWIEEFFVLFEENRISEELALLDEKDEESQLDVQDDSELELGENESSTNESVSEKTSEKAENSRFDEKIFDEKETYSLSGNSMAFMQLENEIFLPPQEKGENSLIQVSGENVFKSYYDDFLRLVKVEQWKIKSFTDAKLIQKEIYVFSSEETRIPSEKSVETDSARQIFYYNEDSLCVKEDEYKKNGEDWNFSARTEWTYDEQNRILSEVVTESSFTKKRTFTYNDDEIPPDFYYYEAGILKMSTVYSSKENYISNVYFDDGFSVTAYYQDGKRIKDVYNLGETVLRVKNYE